MNQSELNALLGKTVLIRGSEHFCCAVGNDRLLLLQWKWHVPEGILIFVMHQYWLPGSPDMGSVLRQRPVPHWRSMTKHS